MALPHPRPPRHPQSSMRRVSRGVSASSCPWSRRRPAAEMPNRRFPLILNTGRMLYHWHGGTMTRRVEGLMARAPGP